jgi:hypothetical protein
LSAAHNKPKRTRYDRTTISSERKQLLPQSALANCTDRYIAEELRRLAEQFERTADAMDSALRTNFATMPDEACIQGFPPATGTGYNQNR